MSNSPMVDQTTAALTARQSYVESCKRLDRLHMTEWSERLLAEAIAEANR